MERLLVTVLAVLLVLGASTAQGSVEKTDVYESNEEGFDNLCEVSESERSIRSVRDLAEVVDLRIMNTRAAIDKIDEATGELREDFNDVLKDDRSVAKGVTLAIEGTISRLKAEKLRLEGVVIILEALSTDSRKASDERVKGDAEKADLKRRCEDHLLEGEKVFASTNLAIARELKLLARTLQKIREEIPAD